MKKIWKSIAAVTLAVVATMGLAACGGEKEIINAYDIAVKNGFQGTEAQWLASLQGANGADGDDLNIKEVYETAKAKGYTGTFLEFLKECLTADVAENNDVDTIAKNVTSVVSVNCAFIATKTYRVNSMFGGYREETLVEASGSAGSGVIIDLDKENGNALVVTNYHVLYSSDSDAENGISECIYLYPYGARNYFTSGAEYNTSMNKYILADVNGDGKADKNDQGDFDGDGIKATFIGGAMDYDIALLQISGSEYLKECAASEATLGDSNTVTVGEKVYAIGNSNGQGISVTAGVVSVESETISMSSLKNSSQAVSYRVLRTDAAINHGNSGGALFNAQGELIGITNAKNVEDETDNMGYALPITQVKHLIDNMQDNGGVVQRAMLGITTAKTASVASFDKNGKLVITEENTVASVDSGVAASGKLEVGDVIKSFTKDGVTTQITRNFYLNDLLLTVRKGDTITLKVFRELDGKEHDVTITFDKDSYFTLYE
ncbi:MAG: trypsin-like peptidase domain-containing protein [Clostridia bacterium]|nr:trypsin-like peptidase domain-containing protein [Clostridia bacterium]